MVSRKWVIACFVLLFALRFIASLLAPGFALDDSYFQLRQASAIQEQGFPDFESGQRELLFSPMFAYILSPFVGGAGVHVVLALFWTLCSVMVYVLAYNFTNRQAPSLLAAILSGFVPASWAAVTSANNSGLAILLILALSYLFIREQKNSVLFVVLLVMLVMLTPFALVFALTVLVYLVFVYIESLKQRGAELELSLFTVFFAILGVLLLFRRAIAVHGVQALYGNAPSALLGPDLSLGLLVLAIGFVPFLAGLWVISQYLFLKKNREVYFLTSLLLTALVFLLFGFAAEQKVLPLIGFVLSVLFAQALVWIEEFIDNTKWSEYRSMARVGLIVVLLLTSVLGSLTATAGAFDDSLNQHDIDALEWLAKQKVRGSIVSFVDEGFAITYYTGADAMLDADYFFRYGEDHYADHLRLLSSRLQIIALDLAEEYDVSYVYYSSRSAQLFNSSFPRYAQDNECFPWVYENPGVKIFERNHNCGVRIVET